MVQINNYYKPPETDIRLNTNEVVLAPRLRRLSAYLLDILIIIVVTFILMFTLVIVFALGAGGEFSFDAEGVYAVLILVTVYLLLNGNLLVKNGQSLGKRIVGICIVDENNNVPDILHIVALRFVVISLLSAIPIVGIIFLLVDVLFIFGPEQRCLHDYLAKTKVILAPEIETTDEKLLLKGLVETSKIADEEIDSSGILYSTYTKVELEETLDSIDKRVYPERVELIKKALERFT